MATLIFSPGYLSRQVRTGTMALAIGSLALVFAVFPAQAQHVVTAVARTQAEALLQQAYSTYQAGDYPQALLLIDKADKLQPDQADSWNLRGAIYLKQAVYDKSTAAFARAVALDPKLWAAQFNLGEVAFHQKDYRRAQTRFEALLGQTDRFKEANRWELVAYKAYLSALLLGDDANAHKKLAKLSAKGVTPAFLYAQAALSYSRKDLATAEKTLALAENTYPAAENELFASSLETVGWRSPAPAPVIPANPASPSSLPASGNMIYANTGDRPMNIDPRLEAAVADPLPVAGGPVYAKIPEVVSPDERNSKAAADRLKPAVKTDVAPVRPAGSPPPALTQDHTGLLLE